MRKPSIWARWKRSSPRFKSWKKWSSHQMSNWKPVRRTLFVWSLSLCILKERTWHKDSLVAWLNRVRIAQAWDPSLETPTQPNSYILIQMNSSWQSWVAKSNYPTWKYSRESQTNAFKIFLNWKRWVSLPLKRRSRMLNFLHMTWSSPRYHCIETSTSNHYSRTTVNTTCLHLANQLSL